MSKAKEFTKDLGGFLAGGGLYALSVNVFTLPADIAPGGATGIATVLNHLFASPVGGVILCLNLPLFLLAARFLGKGFLTKTVISTVMASVLIDLLALVIPPYTGSRLLAAIYGGVFSGLGLSMVFLRGGTTGGTDIAAKLLSRVWKTASVGQLIFALDAVVILFAALVYQDVDSGLYACIVIFTSTTIIDRLLYNAGMGKVIYIISETPQAVAQSLLTRLCRGVTLLHGEGAYSGQERKILLCAVRRNEVWRVKQMVKEVDHRAFMIVSDAGQVLGEGFSSLV